MSPNRMSNRADLQKVMQMKISWAIRDAELNAFENEMHATINVIGGKFDLDKAMDTPREITKKIELKPGLIRRHESIVRVGPFSSFQGFTQFVTTRLAVGSGLRGYLDVREPGRYQFRMRMRGEALGIPEFGGALSLGVTKRVTAQPVSLSRGRHKLRANLPNKATVIEWKSDRFDWEPIPPTALKHDSARDAETFATKTGAKALR